MRSSRSRAGRTRAWLAFVCVHAVLSGLLAVTLPAAAANTVGSFEIDGDLADDSGAGEPVDWDSPEVVEDVFDDPVGNGDSVFKQGSKEFEPGAWVCATGSAPGKSDIRQGALFFRVVGGKQFLAVNYFRAATNGDAHIDYEFNQSTAPNPACPDLPQRTDGDLLMAFDTEKGGKHIFVRLFKWRFTGDGIGVFDPVGGSFERGTHWDAAANIPNEIPGEDAGSFGEAIINLSASPIGDIACNQFGAVSLKTRASSEINSELKDRTKAQPFPGPCPRSSLDKGVRNVTAGHTDFSTTTTASPGDTLEYRLVYSNTGKVAATAVTVTDEVPDRSTLVGCDPPCGASAGSGPGTPMTWSLGTVEAGGTRTVTFQVRLDGVFPAGQTTVTNVATVDTGEEEPKNSNEARVTVTAAPKLSVDKTAPAGPFNVGDTITYTITVTNSGNADGTTDVTDDYDEAHVTVSNISGGGTDSGGKIFWDDVAVPAGNSVALTYHAMFEGPFTSGEGTRGCGDGQFPVTNTVTLENGDSDSHTVCVTANPEFDVTKAASDTSVKLGDTVTYTITVTNVGDAPGSTTVVDDYDQAHIAVSNISGGGTDNGDKITWSSGPLDPGATVIFTYDATFEGTFTEGEATRGCLTGQFPVVNTVTVDGDSAEQVVCVTADPAFEVTKDVSPATANVGDAVTYTITVTNIGDASGSTDVVDDYDQAHIAVSNISGGGSDNGDKITWSSVTLDPGKSATFTYQGRVVGTFAGTNEPCATGHFPVVNKVTVKGDSDTALLCVAASPDLRLAKSADATEVTAGDTITYTLTYSNTGDAEATGVTISEDIPAGTTFASCTGGCATSGDPVTKVTWNVGTVAAGGGGSVTLTVTVADNVGCQVCNIATISSPDQDGGTPRSSNEVCVAAVPVADPDEANASGSAFGAHVSDSLLATDQTFVPVNSSQSGVGSNHADDQVLDVSVPEGTGTVLRADVLRTQATSTVTRTPAAATHLSVAEAAGVDVLDGVVTADFVRGVATTRATGGSASFDSLGSTFKNLKVDLDGAGPLAPQAVNDVTPNTTIALPEALFGKGSYIVLYERVGTTTTPAAGQLKGGTYAADLAVNMIKVHVTALAPLGNQVDVVVSNAVAHSDFPQTQLCDPAPIQAVSGHAFILSATTDPDLAPTVVGYTSIPANGGFDHQDLDEAAVPADGSTASAGASVSESSGALLDGSSTASSFAEATNVCVLRTASGSCTVAAQLVRTESNSKADAGERASDDGDGDGDGDTVLVGLVVAGQAITHTPAPNTVVEVPGVGFLVLNEQTCDNDGTLTNGCADGKVAGHAGLTVRAVRLVVTQPGGLPVGAEVIVAESHSDALFTPAA